MSASSASLPRSRLLAASGWLLLVFAAIYLLDSGHGFIKDDYPWIATSRLARWSDVTRLFVETPMGFYRPLVALSFAVTTPLAGFDPAPYAWTNVALAIAIAGAVFGLGRRLGLAEGPALFAAAAWLFNVHGINMSILWISGRTSLLGTLGAVLAGWAFSAGRGALAGVLLLLALFSKEEPLLLPLVAAGWWWVDTWAMPSRLAVGPASDGAADEQGWSVSRGRVQGVVALGAAVAVYLAVRFQSAAFTLSSAPTFYRLSLGSIADNAVQYLDRAMTFPLALVLLTMLTARSPLRRPTRREGVVMVKGLMWMVGGYGLTVMLPVRSSLYACLPSVGAAIAAAAMISALWRQTRAPRLLIVAALLLPLVLWPVYRARNQRLRAEATLAAETLRVIDERLRATRPQRLVLYDDTAHRPSLSDAFGEWLPLAALLILPHTDGVAISVQPTGAEPPASPDTLAIVMRDGHPVPR